jgi:manganese/iron transport system ATP-binding protein
MQVDENDYHLLHSAMLEVHHLSVNYKGISALEDVNLVLNPGELVGLIGPNGAGKTTLIKAILGLVPIQTGQVLLRARPLRRSRRQVAYVPQRSQIDWNYPITAWNVVMMSQTPSTGWFRNPSSQAKERVAEALHQVGMFDLRHRQIGQLSGGQQQRVFLARAIAQQADLLLFDEPLTGVDKKTEGIIQQIFADLKTQGKTLLVCSHEWGDTLNRYDRLLLLNRTLLANDAPQAVMTFENIQRAYGATVPASTNGDRPPLPFVC